MGSAWVRTRTIQQDGTKGEGGGPTRGFRLDVELFFLEEAVMMFWGDSREDRENNGGYGINKTDGYNITYRGRRRRSYCQIWGRGDFLEAAGCKRWMYLWRGNG